MISRILLLITLLLIAPALLAQTPERAGNIPRLKAVVTVTRDVVRIGDLIDNAGAMSDIAIFRAPDPGTVGSISADRVLEAVRQHDLLLVDAAGITDIEVTRISRTISRADIEARIVRAFATQFPPGGDRSRFAVTFDGEARPIYVDPRVTGDLQVTRAVYSPRSTRFDIAFDVPGPGAMQVRYTGSLVETAPAVILTRPINRGETVRASDLLIERRPKSEITGDTISDIAEATGMSARQALRAGPPLRRADLVKPEIVKREDLVTLIYEVPGIMLTIRGKAIDSGAEGDTINVLNIQSKRTVQGIVTGPGRVTMTTAQPITVSETAEPASPRQSE